MRLFIAAELPSNMLDALAETSALLRASIRGRYVGPDLFHITLAFLGEVQMARIPAIEGTLENVAAGHAPLDVSLAELGHFGKRTKATLWQGVSPAHALDGLAADLRDALERASFEFDAKSFKPHVTLMRNADLSHGSLPTPAIAGGTIDTVTLFKSDLSGPRPVYEALYRAEL